MRFCPSLPRHWRSLAAATFTCATLSAGLAAAVDSNPPAGWWQDATFYEIFVRSFADAKSGRLANDGIGDLQGLIDHLNYLNDGASGPQSLGINAVWLMPIQPSPSYHGYDVTDYFAVNPQFGDVALMKQLVTEAHRRGIRVIIDLVLNHCSNAHPLFQDAVSSDPTRAARAQPYFRFANVPEQLSGAWGERVWHPLHGRFYFGAFGPAMPDWNFRHPAVTEHHRRCAEFWLRDVGVDGFRLDAVRYFYETGDQLQDAPETRQWLREFTAYCHSIKPGAFVVGENTGDMREVAGYIEGRSLDSAFEFDLAKALVQSVQLRTPAILTQALARLEQLYHHTSPWSSFLSNHDQERIMSQLGGDTATAAFAAKLLFTLPGVPFVYYGEELGLTGEKPDPELRTPMPWTNEVPNAGFTTPNVAAWHPVTGDWQHVNVAAEERSTGSLLALYRSLIRLNASSPALRHGTPVALEPIAADAQVFIALRQTDREAALVIANFADTPRRCPALSATQTAVRADWHLSTALDASAADAPQVTTEGAFANWTPVRELAPQSVAVLRWTKP